MDAPPGRIEQTKDRRPYEDTGQQGHKGRRYEGTPKQVGEQPDHQDHHSYSDQCYVQLTQTQPSRITVITRLLNSSLEAAYPDRSLSL